MSDIYSFRAQVLKALAHPVRLKIVELLQQGEVCVCNLVSQFELDQSTISKHLGVMRNAGLVVTRRKGTQIFYSLRTPCIQNFFDCIDTVLRADLDSRQKKLCDRDHKNGPRLCKMEKSYPEDDCTLPQKI